MGDMEMINLSTGKRLIIQMDGTEIRDQVQPPAIEWCDKGQHYANKLHGTGVDDKLWICLACASA
jgi:hypothetical protein